MLALILSLAALAGSHLATPDIKAADILRRLDLNSFPNSTGPRKVAGWKYPSDWSFTELIEEGGSATLARPGDWSISLWVIRQTADGAVVCFLDRAHNGGTYSTRTALRVVGDAKAGYRAVERVQDATCEPLPGHG
ncbi:MAG: hypothetical protein EON89_04865 [Brevundimonas sp.]|nr:MAG: hypothetical protein EON89_04865 [Brevundimonas sp.]